MMIQRPRDRAIDSLFTRNVLTGALEAVVGVPHSVSVLTPLSFQIRPDGIDSDEPGYSVVVERSAFKMRAKVVLDPLGGRIRTAILAGIRANPTTAGRATAVIRDAGWLPETRISDSDLRIGAVDPDAGIRDDEELLISCVNVAAALSELVLSQLVLTRRLETRPAAPREIGDLNVVNPIWEYDPSERDKGTLEHRMLENWLISRITDAGLYPLDSVRGPRFDLAWLLGESLVICEVKSTLRDETKQLRLGLGQLLQYRAQVDRDSPGRVLGALLAGSQPEDEIWKEICDSVGIVLFWPDDGPLPASLVQQR